MRRVALLVMTAGCSQIFGLDTPRLGDGGDGMSIDGPRDAQGGTCIERWMQGPQFATPVPLSANNTGQAERAPFITSDGTTLYYVHEADFFTASRVDAAADFGAGTIDTALSSGNNDSRIYVSSNRVRGFLSSNRNGGLGGSDLWRANRASEADPWTADQMYCENLNGPGDQLDPFLSEDHLHIYYAAKGGSGQSQIMFADRAMTSTSFGTPSQLAGIAASTGADDGPTLSGDELVLVFASTRGGSQDLWYAKRTSVSESFGSPQPLVSLNNSSKADAEPYLTPDGCTLYFASDRAGSMDLYKATLLD
jgi:hypothetical protein